MKKQKLNHFLKHGSLKTARIGMSRKAFKKQNLKRGKKHFFNDCDPSAGFSYFLGGFEIGFYRNKIAYLSADLHRAKYFVGKTRIRPDSPLPHFLRALSAAGIAWRLQAHRFEPQCCEILTEGGILAVYEFAADSGYFGKLVAVRQPF